MIFRIVVLFILFMAGCTLVACASKWTTSDAVSATDAVKGERLIEAMCGDSGTCTPSQVRAIERMDICAIESILHNHGAVVPDGGPKCQ